MNDKSNEFWENKVNYNHGNIIGLYRPPNDFSFMEIYCW